jgi:DNA mismatch repair ATPase MutS
MKDFIAFTNFDWLLERFRPLTPSGRLAKEHLSPLSKNELETEFALIADFIALAKNSPVRADKIEFHLNRIPHLDALPLAQADSVEIFAVKKFLSNARDIFALLPPALSKKLAIKWSCSELLKELSLGGEGETFHVSSSYSPALKKNREAMSSLAAEIVSCRKKRLEQLKKTYGLDFAKRDFIVLEENAAQKLFGNPDFFIEPYDSSHLTLKPVPGAEYLALSSKRDALLRTEKEEEAKIITALAKKIAAHSGDINVYVEKLGRVDLLLAKARLALKFGMKRPQICPSGGAIAVKKGRLLPLEQRLQAEKLDYVPLDCELGKRVCIITGSNMGGKTVALQTVGFLQLCMQLGFYVPAEKYRAPLFDALHFVGDTASLGKVEGLSSFGLELYSFMQAWKDKERHALVLLDEFARTTNSDEAGALLSAVVQAFCARKNIYSLISTHFSGLEAPEAGFYRMKGFDNAAFEKRGAPAGDLRGQLRQINKFMRYELEENCGRRANCDALNVARMLGFDENIAETARKFMEDK